MQILQRYRRLPTLRRPGRKPFRNYPDELKCLIVKISKRYKCGATTVGKILRTRYGVEIANDVIQDVLVMNGLAKRDKNKRVRKKPWIRYERQHSLSAVHMDWYWNSDLKKWVCACLDDASRMILSIGEFESATVENTIYVLKSAYEKYRHISDISAVIVDHGSQFYPVRKNKKKHCKS